ncbi:unnamed protein product, partial [marine sediment metagenome]
AETIRLAVSTAVLGAAIGPVLLGLGALGWALAGIVTVAATIKKTIMGAVAAIVLLATRLPTAAIVSFASGLLLGAFAITTLGNRVRNFLSRLPLIGKGFEKLFHTAKILFLEFNEFLWENLRRVIDWAIEFLGVFSALDSALGWITRKTVDKLKEFREGIQDNITDIEARKLFEEFKHEFLTGARGAVDAAKIAKDELKTQGDEMVDAIEKLYTDLRAAQEKGAPGTPKIIDAAKLKAATETVGNMFTELGRKIALAKGEIEPFTHEIED